MSTQPLCFEHIPKTGGISVLTALQMIYGDKLLDLRHTQRTSHPKGIELFHGHRVIHQLKRFGIEDYRAFTLIREPVSMCMSHYGHIARSLGSKHFVEINLKQRSIRDYLIAREFKDFDNSMVRRFASQDVPFGQCDQNLLDQAIEHLEERFVFVGLLEDFDDSLLLLSLILEWGALPLYFRRNTGSWMPPVSDADKDALHEQNRYDLALYEYGKARFEADRNRLLPQLNTLRPLFHETNARHQSFDYRRYLDETRGESRNMTLKRHLQSTLHKLLS